MKCVHDVESVSEVPVLCNNALLVLGVIVVAN